jgi:glucose/arabinose dehydrogenase/PKD repeat protein
MSNHQSCARNVSWSAVVAIVWGVLLLAGGSVAVAQSEFAAGEDFYEEVVLKDLPIATAIAFAPSNKAYLALKIGIIRVVENGALLKDPFLDISTIVNKVTDRGLLGLAVDPEFPSKPFIYISFVYDPPGLNQDKAEPRVVRIARITADAAENYNKALPNSMEIILGKNGTADTVAPPVPEGDPNIPERASCMTGLTMSGEPIQDCIPNDYESHSAGTLIFGEGRTLFVSVGDGADYTQPNQVALRTQNLDSLSGRVLRINADTGSGVPGNPWYDPERPQANRSKVWMYGFRNPFRITVNPLNQQVYVGDVGTSYYEEINSGKGLNFGWPCYEGGFTERAQLEGQATASTQQVGYRISPRTIDFCNALYGQGQGAVQKPLYTYRHPYDENGKDLGASVTGLAFYHGDGYPSRYKGALFFADYAQNWIRYLTFDTNGRPISHDFAREAGSGLGAVQLLTGPDGNLYAVYIDLVTRTSAVRRFRAKVAGNNPPSVKASVSPLSGVTPLVVAASASQSVDPDAQELSYLWDFGDGTTSSEADAQHVFTKAGTYTVTITVTETTAPFLKATDSFTVRAGVSAPIAHIEYPRPGSLFEIGVPVTFSGHAEGASGAALTYSWNILQIHNEHTHQVGDVAAASGSFIPEEHSDNTSYELCLVVSAGEGLEDQECVVLRPRTSAYTFDSIPRGAPIGYLDEDKEVLAPFVAQPIVGATQTIVAPLRYAGRTFVGWTDGSKDRVRSFVVARTDRYFTAVFDNLGPKALITSRATSLGKRSRRRREIVLDASASLDPEGERLSYAWRFSDGGRARGSTIRKRFKRDGRYRVRLTATDVLGATSKAVKTIIVKNGKVLLR